MTDPEQRLQLAQKRFGVAQGKVVTLEETITLSLEGLPEKASRAFYSLGAFAPKPQRFSREAAVAVTKADALTLALLGARNLLEVDPKRQQLRMHQVLSDVARTRLDEAATARHRAYYLAIPNEDTEDWRRIEAIYGQIKWAWQFLPEEESVLDWASALCPYQQRRGLWGDNLDWANRALEISQREGLRRKEGELLDNIGDAYDNLGQPIESLEYYQKALSIRKEIRDVAGLITTLNNIGIVYERSAIPGIISMMN